MNQKNWMIPTSLIVNLNKSLDFNDPKEFEDPQVFDDPKGISIGNMDFDNPPSLMVLC